MIFQGVKLINTVGVYSLSQEDQRAVDKVRPKFIQNLVSELFNG